MSITAEHLHSQVNARFLTGHLPSRIALSSTPVTNFDFLASGKRGSAVLMLFCSPCSPNMDIDQPGGQGDDCHLIFIRRSTSVKTHRGQISFPGGRCEPDDDSPEETAIRETTEEIGVNPSDILTLGQLPVVQALDDSMIVPVVGVLNTSKATFKPDPSEVAYVFTAPWTNFQNEKSLPFTFNMFGNRRQSHLFSAADHRVWGLTAAILHSANLL